MKFGFPAAFSTTMLCWGVISHKAGYQKTGQLSEAYRTIRWGTDYFIKAHVSEHVFYGQVGNGKADHNYWGRPEDMKIKRPAYRIDMNHPGIIIVIFTSTTIALLYLVSYNNYNNIRWKKNKIIFL